MNFLHSTLIVICLTLFFGCDSQRNIEDATSQNQQQEFSNVNLNEEIELAMGKYMEAIKQTNLDSVLSFWAYDSRVITNNYQVNGKEELRNFLAPSYKGLAISDLSGQTTKLEVTDKLAVHIMEYSQTLSRNGGEEITNTGTQITVWKRINNEWKIVLVSVFPDSPDSIH